MAICKKFIGIMLNSPDTSDVSSESEKKVESEENRGNSESIANLKY
jgi:hypothetical protein